MIELPLFAATCVSVDYVGPRYPLLPLASEQKPPPRPFKKWPAHETKPFPCIRSRLRITSRSMGEQ